MNFGVDHPPPFEKRSHFDLFAECFLYGMKKDAFGFCQIWVGFCPLWGEEGFIWVLSYMGGVCHIWGQQRYLLFFFKYGLGFVTYGVKKDSFGFCLIWVGFVTYGVSKDTFGFCQIWVGFFHLSGQRRYTRDLSNMAWVLSLMG